RPPHPARGIVPGRSSPPRRCLSRVASLLPAGAFPGSLRSCPPVPFPGRFAPARRCLSRVGSLLPAGARFDPPDPPAPGGTMTSTVSYDLVDSVATITLDDGKVNVLGS